MTTLLQKLDIIVVRPDLWSSIGSCAVVFLVVACIAAAALRWQQKRRADGPPGRSAFFARVAGTAAGAAVIWYFGAPYLWALTHIEAVAADETAARLGVYEVTVPTSGTEEVTGKVTDVTRKETSGGMGVSEMPVETILVRSEAPIALEWTERHAIVTLPDGTKSVPPAVGTVVSRIFVRSWGGAWVSHPEWVE